MISVDGDVAVQTKAKTKPKTVYAWQAGRGGIFYDTTDGVGREKVREGDWLVQEGEGDGARLTVLTDNFFRSIYEVPKAK